MPKEIFEVVRERFHLSDRTQYIVQGHWPKTAKLEAYLDNKKLETSVKENENVSALERFQDPEKMGRNADYSNHPDSRESEQLS